MFGAKRGAYSGAEADATGYVQEADGGTLFLDEIAELDLQVQAKLLRVLEPREVLPLGASKPRKVEYDKQCRFSTPVWLLRTASQAVIADSDDTTRTFGLHDM